MSSRLSWPAVEPKRSEVELLFLFCPSDLTAPNKSHHPPLCHPERTRISYLTALPTATYAALRKESRMKSTEATVFDRKSGEAERPAVRPGSCTKVSVSLALPQNRHHLSGGIITVDGADLDSRTDFRCPSTNGQADASDAPGYPLRLSRPPVCYHLGDGPGRSRSLRQYWSGTAGACGASHHHHAGRGRDRYPFHAPLHGRGLIANEGIPDCAGRSGLYVVRFPVWAEPVRWLQVQSV